MEGEGRSTSEREGVEAVVEGIAEGLVGRPIAPGVVESPGRPTGPTDEVEGREIESSETEGRLVVTGPGREGESEEGAFSSVEGRAVKEDEGREIVSARSLVPVVPGRPTVTGPGREGESDEGVEGAFASPGVALVPGREMTGRVEDDGESFGGAATDEGELEGRAGARALGRELSSRVLPGREAVGSAGRYVTTPGRDVMDGADGDAEELGGRAVVAEGREIEEGAEYGELADEGGFAYDGAA